MSRLHQFIVAVGATAFLTGCGGVDFENAASLSSGSAASIKLFDAGKKGVLEIFDGAGNVLLASVVGIKASEDGKIAVRSTDDKGVYFQLASSSGGYFCTFGCAETRPYRLPMMWALNPR